MIKPWLKCSYPEEEFDWFFDGGWKQWADDYRGILFNDRDIQSKRNSTARHHYFHEWFSAITIFNRYGLRSLVGKYATKDAAHRNTIRPPDALRQADFPPFDERGFFLGAGAVGRVEGE